MRLLSILNRYPIFATIRRYGTNSVTLCYASQQVIRGAIKRDAFHFFPKGTCFPRGFPAAAAAAAARTAALCRGYTHRSRPRCCPTSPSLPRFKNLVRGNQKIGRNVHAHSIRFPRTRVLPVSQKMLVRTSAEETCRPTCLISSSEKLGQRLGRINRCVQPRLNV